jgi:Holliday junction resolvase RusA-like endonuclease
LEQSNITYVIDYPPVPWARAGSSYANRYDTQKELKKSYLFLLQQYMKQNKLKVPDTPPSCPLHLDVIFHIKSPQHAQAKKVTGAYVNKRGDLDNYIKFLLDAFNGYLYQDDSQIVYLEARKIYGEPRTVFTLTKLGAEK